MPTRFIKESARTSKNLQALTDFGERLFWRLLTTADDHGKFMACPMIVRSSCFPLSETMKASKVTEGLKDLVANGLIQLYSVGDREYGQFCTFEKHQGKARAHYSKYPDNPHQSPILHAPASICVQTQTTQHHHCLPSDSDTDTDLNSLNSLSSPNLSKEDEEDTFMNFAIAAWNVIPGVKRLKTSGPMIRKRIITRYREHPDREWWTQLYLLVLESDFLCGRSGDFAASLDWALGPKNLEKILAGNYVNRVGREPPKSMADYLAGQFPSDHPGDA